MSAAPYLGDLTDDINKFLQTIATGYNSVEDARTLRRINEERARQGLPPLGPDYQVIQAPGSMQPFSTGGQLTSTGLLSVGLGIMALFALVAMLKGGGGIREYGPARGHYTIR